MNILCLGTFLKIVKENKGKTSKQVALITDILNTVQKEDWYKDDSFQGGLISGSKNLANYGKIISCDKNDLIKVFETNVKTYFDTDAQKLIILCLRDIIKNDSMDALTKIGFEDEGYTKQDILNKQVFPFAEFLANVYYFCTTARDNRTYNDYLKGISSKDVITYIESFRPFINDIQLETKTTHIYSKVKLTLDPKPFNEIFKEIKTNNLSISNNNHLKMYCLDVINSKFNYNRLQDFIANNIGRYIYSRAMRNNYNISPELGSLTLKAIRAYKKRIQTTPTINHFNEIMLYSFLECVLGAPKIFSKMELQNKNGTYESKTSGIHILSLKKNELPFNQLIFGATDTVDSLTEAVDNAFNQVTTIVNHIPEEMEFIEDTILSEEFDSETNKSLEDLIIPKKESNLNKPDRAFGIFLGYTPNIEKIYSNNEYIEKIIVKLNEDIDHIETYINNKIEALNLKNYSFYIYILPFDNASIDHDEIIKKALEV